MKSIVAILTTALFALFLTADAEPKTQPEITEWTVPWESSRPRDPWHEQTGHYQGW